MLKRFTLYLFIFLLFGVACEENIETPNLDLELEYQPLEIGKFWIYGVDETIFFGENDSETEQYFYRDRIRSRYLNEQNEFNYIVERSKSQNRSNWVFELEYTMIHRNKVLLRTINNQPLVALVFPPILGKNWNGKIYQAEGKDEFEIVDAGVGNLPGFEGVPLVRVNQENLDDKITIRDVRYEIFGKEIGLLEKYDEVLTYCSRNDCLGKQLIDSGKKTHLKLLEYGKN
ncbi:hypothetical protein SAMN03080617_03020 [Algoriphagus alkaliphilus]|uniref:Lipoprotein n=1 Tax=Algoriphagus alkaliphilus TaxID=279824 RepID=A0A1G5YZK6_9BACT|nr:hypothetical protein [Algoriphagus alkaliphilus]SDA87936.1 hypothetical protein SAMN03080617_03020 [Algoriphagus alkaliphilus]